MKTDPFLPPATEEIRLVDISAFSGTLQDGIKGNYDFSISDVFKEAWQKTDGVKGTFFAAVIIAMIINSLILVGMMLVFPMEYTIEGMELTIMTRVKLFLQQIITGFVSLPILVGIIMIGVRRSVELPVRFSIVFDYFRYAIPLVIAFFLIGILLSIAFLLVRIPTLYLNVDFSHSISISVIIGYFLLSLPAIYLFAAYHFFTLPLIVEKNLGPWEAMEASRKAVTHHWFKVFFTIIIMYIILFISMLTLGIALIWTLPMMFNVIGILYRIMFGVEEAR